MQVNATKKRGKFKLNLTRKNTTIARITKLVLLASTALLLRLSKNLLATPKLTIVP